MEASGTLQLGEQKVTRVTTREKPVSGQRHQKQSFIKTDLIVSAVPKISTNRGENLTPHQTSPPPAAAANSTKLFWVRTLQTRPRRRFFYQTSIKKTEKVVLFLLSCRLNRSFLRPASALISQRGKASFPLDLSYVTLEHT